MKAGRAHRAALSSRATAILTDLKDVSQSAFVFSGVRPGRPISNSAFLQLLRNMGRSDMTPHGFRSSFRDWAAEQTAYPNEVVEMALAHSINNRVEAAYRRGDLFEKRRQLMEDWSRHCHAPAAPPRKRARGAAS
jgi:integrase